MNETVESTYNRTENQVSVRLYSNGISKDGCRFGRIPRDRVTVEHIIASIIDENQGMNLYQFKMAISLFKDQVLKMVKLGKCVNMLDLGLLYITTKGTVKGEHPNKDADLTLTPRFTPSQLLNEAVGSLQIKDVTISDTNPYIDSVKNTWTNEEWVVYPDKVCKIKGKRIKLGGDSYSICFVPLNEDGTEATDKPLLEVDKSKISKNTFSTLEFYAPAELDPSVKYLIRITTRYLTGDLSRKTPLVIKSDVITVEA